MAKPREVVLSANGSPINVVDTVKAKAGKRGRPEIVVSLPDGREVNLAEDDERRGLEQDDAARETTVHYLLELQSQVDAHLAALQKGNLPEM
jgi:hypothetical protein